MPSKQKYTTTEYLDLSEIDEEPYARKERIDQKVDDFVKAMEKLPPKELPNGQLSLRSFSHHDKLVAFIRQMCVEYKPFSDDEQLEVH
jgi:hypothetical protein